MLSKEYVCDVLVMSRHEFDDLSSSTQSRLMKVVEAVSDVVKTPSPVGAIVTAALGHHLQNLRATVIEALWSDTDDQMSLRSGFRVNTERSTIERIDVPADHDLPDIEPVFANDADALRYVQWHAKVGRNDLCIRALRVIGQPIV